MHRPWTALLLEREVVGRVPIARRDGERDLLHQPVDWPDDGDAVEIVGALQPTPTIATGYAIYPFVGVIEPGMTWTPSAREVAQVLELSLREVRDGYERQRLIRRGIPILTDTYVVGEHLIWGATAR